MKTYLYDIIFQCLELSSYFLPATRCFSILWMSLQSPSDNSLVMFLGQGEPGNLMYKRSAFSVISLISIFVSKSPCMHFGALTKPVGLTNTC